MGTWPTAIYFVISAPSCSIRQPALLLRLAHESSPCRTPIVRPDHHYLLSLCLSRRWENSLLRLSKSSPAATEEVQLVSCAVVPSSRGSVAQRTAQLAHAVALLPLALHRRRAELFLQSLLSRLQPPLGLLGVNGRRSGERLATSRRCLGCPARLLRGGKRRSNARSHQGLSHTAREQSDKVRTVSHMAASVPRLCPALGGGCALRPDRRLLRSAASNVTRALARGVARLLLGLATA